MITSQEQTTPEVKKKRFFTAHNTTVCKVLTENDSQISEQTVILNENNGEKKSLQLIHLLPRNNITNKIEPVRIHYWEHGCFVAIVIDVYCFVCLEITVPRRCPSECRFHLGTV